MVGMAKSFELSQLRREEKLKRRLAFLASLAVLVASCSAGGGDDSGGDGSTVVYATPTLAVTTDPCSNNGNETGEVLLNLYETWVNYPSKKDADGVTKDDTTVADVDMAPGLLESWEVSPEGTVWTLKLRDDIVDSNGAKMTSKHAAWSFERYLNRPGCAFIAASLTFESMDQFKIIDDLTFQITLPKPNPIFLRTLNVNTAMPVGPSVMDHVTPSDPWATEWLKTNAPAVGPYQLEAWNPGQDMIFTPNPNWNGDEPDIKRVIYRQVPESSNRMALLQQGVAQLARSLSQEELDTVDKSGTSRAQCLAANQFIYLGLNTTSGPTADPAVRRALAYAVPYDEILSSVYRDRGARYWSIGTSTYRNVISEDQNVFHYDIAEAKKQLAATGQGGGFALPMLVTSGNPAHEQVAVILKNSFAKIGVDVQIDRKPRAAYSDLAFARDFQAMIDQNYSFIPDITYHSNVWFISSDPPNENYTGWVNPEFDKLRKETVQMKDDDARAAKQVRMQEIFLNDSPWLLLGSPPTCVGLNKAVQGYVWHSHNQIIFDELSLQRPA